MTPDIATFKRNCNHFDFCSCIRFLEQVEQQREEAISRGDVGTVDQMDALLQEATQYTPEIHCESTRSLGSFYSIITIMMKFINGVQKVLDTLEVSQEELLAGGAQIAQGRASLQQHGISTTLQQGEWVVA